VAAATGDHAILLWDLRLLRRQLRTLGLDWERPPYPPADARPAPGPVTVVATAGEDRRPSNPDRAEEVRRRLGRALIHLGESLLRGERPGRTN
jgi:hypothetical protein